MLILRMGVEAVALWEWESQRGVRTADRSVLRASPSPHTLTKSVLAADCTCCSASGHVECPHCCSVTADVVYWVVELPPDTTKTLHVAVHCSFGRTLHQPVGEAAMTLSSATGNVPPSWLTAPCPLQEGAADGELILRGGQEEP